MEKETWKPVVGYEGLYECSDMGRVKSLNYRNTGNEGILKPSPEGKGYLQVKLFKNGEKSIRRVHQLVMRAFFGECPDGFEIDHIDWNQRNNRLDNLRYQPKGVNRGRKSPEWQKNNAEGCRKRSQNQEWRKNQAEATRKANSKPVNQYTLDGTFIKTWSSAADAARELGLSKGNISQCCNGKQHTAGGYVWKLKEVA